MKIIIPYHRVNASAESALRELGIDYRPYDTSLDDEAYFRVLEAVWDQGEGFIVLEGDKVPDGTALQELWNCKHDWCTYPVPLRDGTDSWNEYASLSCTKFSTELIHTLPNLFEDVARFNMGFGHKHWDRLNLAVWCALRRHVDVHWHGSGRVAHLHQT